MQRQAVQAVLAHQVRTDARQVAFVGAREALVQQAGDGQTQHGVAQELEPLVVVGAAAAVRERARQQPRLAEDMAQPLLQGVESRVHGTARASATSSSTALRT